MLLKGVNSGRGDIASPGACQSGQQTLGILGRAQQMRRLHQALQLIGGNQGNRTTRAAAHQNHFAVIDRTVHERLELLAGLAVGGFDGHGGFPLIGQRYCTTMKQQVLADRIELWPTSRLIPYARNPRKNDHAVDQMAAVIAEFGFRIPIIAKSTAEVVDGHLHLKAALRLGLEQVPIILADDLTPTQIKALRILANRSATWADWDEDLLRLELEELKLDDFDLALTGFDADELLDIMAGDEPNHEGQTDEDVAADQPETIVSTSFWMDTCTLLAIHNSPLRAANALTTLQPSRPNCLLPAPSPVLARPPLPRPTDSMPTCCAAGSHNTDDRPKTARSPHPAPPHPLAPQVSCNSQPPATARHWSVPQAMSGGT